MKTEFIETETIEFPKPEIKKETRIITHPIIKFYNATNVKIHGLELTDELLRIDFIHHAGREYIRGGWVRIEPSTFIRPQGTSFKLPMLKAEGIPLAPHQHWYKSTEERLFFSLYFPSISKDVEFIDIIEKEGGGSTFFNFYGVFTKAIQKSPINIQGIHYTVNDN